MDAGGAAQLGQAHQLLLDLQAAGHHQVGQFVHDQHQEGHRLGGLGVVAGDVADSLFLHELVASGHLVDEAAQGGLHLVRLHDHGHHQVRDAVERRELNTLGVNHDHPQLVRRAGHQQGRDQRVDADALAGPGCARDEQVGHGCQVQRQGLPAGVLSQGKGEAALLNDFAELRLLDDGAHQHLAGGRVGHFQPHQSLAGFRGLDDADVGAFQGQRQVLLPLGDVAHADPAGALLGRLTVFVQPGRHVAGHQAEPDDPWAGLDVLNIDIHAVLGQRILDIVGHRGYGRAVDLVRFRWSQGFQRRQLPPAGTGDIGHRRRSWPWWRRWLRNIHDRVRQRAQPLRDFVLTVAGADARAHAAPHDRYRRPGPSAQFVHSKTQEDQHVANADRGVPQSQRVPASRPRDHQQADQHQSRQQFHNCQSRAPAGDEVTPLPG